MLYSLLEIDNWEFRRVNKYLEQVMKDIKEENIEDKRMDKVEKISGLEEKKIQKIPKRK